MGSITKEADSNWRMGEKKILGDNPRPVRKQKTAHVFNSSMKLYELKKKSYSPVLNNKKAKVIHKVVANVSLRKAIFIN
ncbi:hypothetical protein [Pseudoalteromonas luteoviolacea]|uniref:hypothetical protein n=1 Tax=Pseudoalteromonas luteoviolacea TaxID=43657 RepID=UPI00115449F7|nr:hypothetical protein [Pseudoalteromonas luteoviolacea]TQF67679.1 hypothetical protein FLM44_21090 [Pseudoalteromonas luteoviolacea]